MIALSGNTMPRTWSQQDQTGDACNPSPGRPETPKLTNSQPHEAVWPDLWGALSRAPGAGQISKTHPRLSSGTQEKLEPVILGRFSAKVWPGVRPKLVDLGSVFGQSWDRDRYQWLRREKRSIKCRLTWGSAAPQRAPAPRHPSHGEEH